MTERAVLASIFKKGEPSESPPWPQPPVDLCAIPRGQWKEYAFAAVLLPYALSKRIDRMLESGEAFTDEICDEIETATTHFSGLPVKRLRWETMRCSTILKHPEPFGCDSRHYAAQLIPLIGNRRKRS